MMHMVMENSTAFIKDAVAIAKEYSFDGWFIDYEDEYPPDSDPNVRKNVILPINSTTLSFVFLTPTTHCRSTAVRELRRLSVRARRRTP